MATYMNQTNSGRIIVQQTSPSAIIVQPDNERKIILKGSGGLKGETGEQGPAGEAATIAVGTTSTLAPGASATVTNSGTSSAAVLDFGIPKGEKGDTGATGPANTLSIGTVQKGDTADATITGDAPNQTLNLTLPKGDKGDTGAQGPAGAGVVAGGSTGQVLTKKSGTDYDTEWTTPTTYSDFTGATSSVAGAHGLVPAPTTSDPDKFLKGDGTWGTPPGATYTGGTGIDITDNVVSVDNTIATVTDLGSKVNIASIDLTSQTADLLALTKALGTAGTDYARWICKYNGGAANISNKPTGSTNESFVCEAYCARWASSSDYRYNLIAWSTVSNNPYVAYVTNDSSSIAWDRLRPEVNDATLTITQNGTTLGTFTANSSTNKTIDVPGGGSTYTAGTGIDITSDVISVDTSTVAMQTDLPTKTSDLTNDGADGTSTYVEVDDLNPGDVSGEGTDITLPGTQGGRFSDVKLKGDTEQGIALPDGYQQVEYIASAGGNAGAYIDSGIKASNTIKVVTTAALTSGFLFGEGLQGNWVNFGIQDGNGYYRGRIRKDASSNSEVTSTVALGDTFHTIEMSQGNGLWIDGSKIGTFTSFAFTATNTMYIHAWQNGSGANLQAVAKIKDFKIYDNNTLVKWFVPCKRISDGVAGYYEMVGGTFKPSASGTAFTAGGVTPTPSTPQAVQTVTGEQTIAINDGDQQSQTYTINLGKNIVDLSKIVVAYGINTSTGALGYQAERASMYKIPVKPSTTYVATCATGYQLGGGTTTYGANGAYIGNSGSGWVTTKTVTTDANTYFVSFVVKNDAGTSLAGVAPDTFKVQMEEGSTATTYTPHVELCKIGNYQDYIYKSNGTWYLHKETDRVTDNGTKNYQARTNTSATHSKFYVDTDDLLNYPIAGTTTLVSDHFIANIGANEAAYSNSATCGSTTSGYTKRLWYSVPNSVATTAAAFKTWIAANPVTTYYAMATPTDTPIAGTLLDDLNAFDQATSYQGNTYITVSSVSPDLPATLSVTVEQESALPVATETSVGVVSVGDGLSITGGGVLSVDSSRKEMYSTEEQVVGTWIDGKPIYRKVISADTTAGSSLSVPVGTNDIATVVKADVLKTTVGTTTDAVGSYYASSSDYFRYWVRKTQGGVYQVELRCSSGSYSYTIVIEYTKTTD